LDLGFWGEVWKKGKIASPPKGKGKVISSGSKGAQERGATRSGKKKKKRRLLNISQSLKKKGGG